MSVKLNSTGGGSVTLDSPSTASNYTVTLPSAAGTLATTTGTGSVFTNPTINGFTGDTSAITVGTTQFVKDTSGNIGIGTASPSYKLDVAGIVRISNGGDTYIGFGANKDNYWTTGTASGKQIWRNSSGSEFLTLDSSGNLGLGVTPSASWQSGRRVLQVGGSAALWATSGSAGSLFLSNNVYFDGTNFRYLNTSGASYLAQATDGSYSFNQAPSGTAGNAITFNQVMTLDASGNLLVGDTATIDSSKMWVKQTANAPSFEAGNTNASLSSIVALVRASRNTTNGSFQALNYYNDGAAANRFFVIDSGAIYSTSTSITGISDVRHKENIRDLDTGLSAVLALKPRRFDWKEGKGIDRKDQPGFIAQEVEKVLPELIELWTESQEDKNEYKGIRLADMIPTLVKAIQELSAQNQVLEARLAQLEAK